MRKHALLRLILWSIVTFILSGLFIFFLFSPFENHFNFFSWSSYHYDHSELYLYGNGEISADQIQQLDVHWNSGQVDILPYDGDMIQFSEDGTYSEKDALHYYVDQNKLIIHFAQSQRWLRHPSAKHLTILVPQEAFFKDIDIELISANISMDGLQAQSIDIETVSGDLKASNIACQDIDINTVSGRCQLQGAFNSLEAETVSGDCSFDVIGLPSKIAMDSVSGNVDIYLEENDGFTAKIDSLSGKLSCDFASIQDKKQIIYKDGSARFDFDSVSGDVHIHQK